MEELKNKIEDFVTSVQALINAHYAQNFPNQTPDRLEISYGKVYAKIVSKRPDSRGGSTWAFVALEDKPKLNAKRGDLLMAASLSAPAKHGRGSILDGTATYGVYGPTYLR